MAAILRFAAFGAVATIAAVAGGRFVASQRLAWLWTDELGTPNLDLQRAGARAVLGMAVACIVIAGLVGLRRAAPTSRLSLALGFFAVTLVASAMLWNALRLLQPSPALTASSLRQPLPSSPDDVFTADSWAMAEQYVGRYRNTSWEVRRYVPYDPKVLERVSFVGLSTAQVEKLLTRGTTPFSDPAFPYSSLVYEMVPPPACASSFLSLRLDYSDLAELVVVKEAVWSNATCKDKRPEDPSRP